MNYIVYEIANICLTQLIQYLLLGLMAYITLLLLATLKMSTRDFSWGKGSRCIRLMTYHPRSAECQENPGP